MNYCRLQAWKYAIKKHDINTDAILDVGCSYGSWYENWKVLGFDKMIGVEPGKDEAAKARKNYDVVKEAYAHTLKDVFDKKFNTIAANGVLVHVLKDDEVISFVQGVSSVLDDNGLFICSVLSAEYYSYGEEQYNENNCTRLIEHSVQLIEKSGLKVINKIGTFINPWALKELMYTASDDYDLKKNPELFETFAKLSDLLREHDTSPFSEILLVCRK